MKKLTFLFIAIFAISLSSCSSSDEPTNPPVQQTNFVKANIDGTDINFDVINVEKEVFSEYTDLHVTATKSNDPTKIIHFDLAALEIGDNTCYYFNYNNDANEYYYDRDATDGVHNKSFTISLLDNTANNIKGSFTGKLNDFDNKNSVTIFNGSFDITF